MIQLYGSPRSSAARCFWMLEECGLKFEVPPLDMANKAHKSPEFLKMNPNGKVPVLNDNGFILWESGAIVHYLAEKYRPELAGRDPQEKGLVSQWMYWSLLEFQPPVVDIIVQKLFVPEDKRDHALIEKRASQLPHFFKIADEALKDKAFLVGQHFTIADLTLATVFNTCVALGFSLSEFPQVSRWFEQQSSRPGFKKLKELREQK